MNRGCGQRDDDEYCKRYAFHLGCLPVVEREGAAGRCGGRVESGAGGLECGPERVSLHQRRRCGRGRRSRASRMLDFALANLFAPTVTAADNLLRIFLCALAIAAIAGAATAASPTLDRIKATGTVTFAYRDGAAPFSFKARNGRPQGYSVELCEKVAAAIGKELAIPALKIEWLPVDAANRLDAVASGQVDADCGTTTITLSGWNASTSRCPIFVDGGSVLVRAKDHLARLADLKGKKIAVIPGTTTEQALQRRSRSSRSTAEFVPVKNGAEGMALLLTGKVDAYAADRVVLAGLKLAQPERRARVHHQRLFVRAVRAGRAPRRSRFPAGGQPRARRASTSPATSTPSSSSGWRRSAVPGRCSTRCSTSIRFRSDGTARALSRLLGIAAGLAAVPHAAQSAPADATAPIAASCSRSSPVSVRQQWTPLGSDVRLRASSAAGRPGSRAARRSFDRPRLHQPGHGRRRRRRAARPTRRSPMRTSSSAGRSRSRWTADRRRASSLSPTSRSSRKAIASASSATSSSSSIPDP